MQRWWKLVFIVCYFLESSRGKCVGLYCCGERVGLIKPATLPHLLSYKDVFVRKEVNNGVVSVQLADHLISVEERTKAVNKVFADLQLRGCFPCLKGWRNEVPLVLEELKGA